jgi:type I restriction enzyme S subunit
MTTSSNLDDLPQGWSEVELHECVDVLDNQRVPVNSSERAKRQGDVPYFGATGQVGWIDEALFDEELLLIGEDGAPFFDKSKPIAYVIKGKSWVNNHAHVICAKSGISSNQYLKWFLDCFDFNEYVNGTTRLKLTQGAMNRIPVRLAPLAEQRRIVAKLEKLLGQVDACQQRLEKLPTLLKRFRQSVLAAACSGRLTADWREENPNVDDASGLIAELERVHEAAGGHKKGNAAAPSDEAHNLSADDLPPTWRLTEMRSVVCPDRPITYGILKPGPETPGGILYVRVADFPNDRLNLETIRRTSREIEKTFARARLRTGDILLSIRGTVGRVCVVPQELENANITQDTARLSVQPALNAGFVKWFLRAAPTQKRMQKAVKGVAVRGINIGDVRALQMPVPPLVEQQEIVRRVEGLFALADQLEQRLAQARKQVDKLTPSLLARAFAGQLVPQDPKDEPAEKLLARVKLTKR